MTSGAFQAYPVSSIVINRDERQRRTLSQIDELAESIHRIGLINPPVITRDGVLVAGERRLTAVKTLGWTHISVQFVEDLSEYELQTIELEENVKRMDLTWQEECLAMQRFHQLKIANEPSWSQEKTAQALGYDQRTISSKLAVAASLDKENISSADKFSVARNMVQRETERKKSTDLIDISSLYKKLLAEDREKTGEPPLAEPVAPVPPLLLADFHEWQEAYAGPKFNLIHCDFPYGINVADSPRMSAAIQDYYDDSPDIYWTLLGRLAHAMDNVVAESAHLIFWFSMKFYTPTFHHLTEMGWKVDPFPLVWAKSDACGIAPDPQRGPRRTYETAFFASRGDRKLTQAGTKSASIIYPGKKGDDEHMSEKPEPMLRHFLSMICDEYSQVLDPTCGSGNALKAATALGAHHVLGLEKSEQFYDDSYRRYFK